MVRLSEIAATQREHLESLSCPEFTQSAHVPPRALSECRVALISSAGLMKRKDENVPGNSNTYREFDSKCPDREILINHVSVNFDRSAFSEDINSIFPRELLTEMAQDGTIEHAANIHYSYMGATEPKQLQASAEQLAKVLTDAQINTVCLLPV